MQFGGNLSVCKQTCDDYMNTKMSPESILGLYSGMMTKKKHCIRLQVRQTGKAVGFLIASRQTSFVVPQ